MSQARLYLNPQSLPARVSAATYEQGVNAYRSQQVLECNLSRVNSHEWGIEGQVDSYDTSVVAETNDAGDIIFFSSKCSCRVSINCRHAIALTVKAAYKAASFKTPGNAAPPRASTKAEAVASPQAPATQSLQPVAGMFDIPDDPREFAKDAPTQDSSTGLTPSGSALSQAASSVLPVATELPRNPTRLKPANLSGKKNLSLDLFAEPEPDASSDLFPASPAAPALQGVRPVAHLHITPVHTESTEQLGLLRATLRFDYQGIFHYALHDHNPVLLERSASWPDAHQQSAQLLLHRDLLVEHAAHHSLRTLGLSGDSRGQFYLPFISHAQQQVWLQWLDSGFTALQDAGFTVTFEPRLSSWIARADDLHAHLEPEGLELAAPGDSIDAADLSHSAFFSLSLGMHINGSRRNILPLLPELLAQLSSVMQGKPASKAGDTGAGATLQLPPYIFLRQEGGSYLRLPCEQLRPWLQALLDLTGERASHKDADFQGHSLRLSRLEALRVGAALFDDQQSETRWKGADKLRETVSQLAGRSDLPDIDAPHNLRAALRPYQLEGLRWLQFLRGHRLGGILADDMGLGKTLQTLAHILTEKNAGRLDLPVLVMAPVSLMGNWHREAARFTPDLNVLVLHGNQRHRGATRMAQHDIVVAPYSLLLRDSERWQAQHWHLVVLDEAQNIKNANSHAAKIVSRLTTRHRLCLSGTPMENHLGELWSLFNFLMPGFLGSQARFKALYRTPIEKHNDTERADKLRRRLTPFMLRRHKRDVAADLPDKQIAISSVELGDSQADLYETIRLSTEKTVRDALGNKGLAQSQIQILDALLKLRQVCCDPRLVAVPAAQKVKQTAKLELLMELLPEMIAEGRKVLLFSQFTSMLSLIEEELEKRGMAWTKLTGQSQNRDEIIDRFTSGAVPLFLISLKAGGVGLNLTQADTVIHYDPWWNPAAENQATDRAHRIGQTQRVMVYKLVAQGTIEERILDLQERKAALAESLYSGEDSGGSSVGLSTLTETDLDALLQPLGRQRDFGMIDDDE